MDEVTIERIDGTGLGPAQIHGLSSDGVEDRLGVVPGTADDLEDLAGRSLLRQRLAQLGLGVAGGFRFLARGSRRALPTGRPFGRAHRPGLPAAEVTPSRQVSVTGSL